MTRGSTKSCSSCILTQDLSARRQTQRTIWGCGDGDMTAGEDKCLHGRQLAVHVIDVLLEGFHVLVFEVGNAHFGFFFGVARRGRSLW